MSISTLDRLLIFIAGFSLVGGFWSCELQMREPRSIEVSHNIHTAIGDSVPEVLPLIIIYHLDTLKNAAEVDSFKTSFSPEAQELIFSLNRMDAYRLNPGDKIIIPDTLTQNYLDYSPFPTALELLNSIPKAVLVSRRVQAFAMYENGRQIHWGAVSTGKQSTPTPAGLFYGNYKARSKVSTVNESWIMPYYFNFLNFDGVGVHQYAMPGYPASHACVRLFENDAKAIYNWADQWKLDRTGSRVQKNGTPFMVFGEYDFTKEVPWLELAENPNANYLTSAEMETLRTYVLAYAKDPRNFDPPVQVVPSNAPPAEGLETVQ